jgi:large subunit ribosomal protein L15
MGRGRAAGQGKSAGRGTKGWGAHHNPKPGFEGGQMPLQRRVPKIKGFQNPNRVEWAVVNVDRLAETFASGTVVSPDELLAKGIVRKGMPVKVLGRGEIDRALTVRVQAVSATARGKIEAAGGTIELLESR